MTKSLDEPVAALLQLLHALLQLLQLLHALLQL
jgi:hypothetical protein